MHNFRQLEIWKEGMELAKNVYEITHNFPEKELFGLTAQLRRCAVSIPSNIAEGSGRDSNKNFIYFLSIAKASSHELLTQLLLAKEFNYISDENLFLVLNKIEILQKKFTASNKSSNNSHNPNKIQNPKSHVPNPKSPTQTSPSSSQKILFPYD